MKALLFIVMVVGLGVLISLQFVDDEATWFEYYRGGIGGLFVSAALLELWNTRIRKKEEKDRNIATGSQTET